MHVKEYDGEPQLNFTLRNRENDLKKEPQLAPSISPARNQVSQMHLQSSIFSNQHSVEMGKAVGGEELAIFIIIVVLILQKMELYHIVGIIF